MKSFRFNNSFKVIFPDEWDIENDSNILSLYDPDNGVGALQFTSYRPPNIDSIRLDKELEDYLHDKHGVVTVELHNNFSYCSLTDKDKFYWRYWLLRGKNEIMFISYNCEVTDKGKENRIVDDMIKSML